MSAGVGVQRSRSYAASRRAGLVVAAWTAAAVVLVLSAPSLAKVGVQNETALLPSGSASVRAQATLTRLFPDDPTLNSAVAVLSRPRGLTPSDRAYITRLGAFLSSPALRPEITRTESPASGGGPASVLSSADRSTDLVVVGLRAAPFTPQADSVVTRVRAFLEKTAPPGLAHPVTGVEAIGTDEGSGLNSSFTRAAVISVVLVLAILMFVYRSVVAALVPLATIGVSFLVAEGLISLLAAHVMKVASLAAVLMVVMVFGAGTDYCLFLVSRYRQELARSDRAKALGRARSAVGPVVVASGATVILAFLAQLTARFGMYRTMGPAIGIAIAVTVVAGLTLTPALLTLVGRWAFWPAGLEDAGAATPGSRRWEHLAAQVGSHPGRLSMAMIAALAAASTGTFWLHQSYDLVSEVPGSSGAAEGAALLGRHFPPGDLGPIEVLIQSRGPISTAGRLAAIDHLTDELKAVPGVSQVRSATQPSGSPITARAPAGQLGGLEALKALGLDPNAVDVTPLYTAMASPQGLRLTGPVLASYPQLGRQVSSYFYGSGGASTRLLVAASGDPFSPAALHLVPKLQKVTGAAVAAGPLAGADVEVGGAPADFHDISVIASGDFDHIIMVVLAVILVVLCLLLRSLVAPLYLLGTVVLSFGAALGLTVAVFSLILGRGGLPFFLPPLLFVILVALGADYNIFLTGRMREALDGGAGSAEAALTALVETGPVISSAGLILAGTFFALLFAPLAPLAEVGFAVTVGVLIDTFLVRTALVPALTVWVGDAAFWRPSWTGVSAGTRRALGNLEALALLGAIGVLVPAVIAVAVHSPQDTTAASRSKPAPATPSGDRASPVPGPVVGAISADRTTLRPTGQAQPPTAAQGSPATVGANTGRPAANPPAPPPTGAGAPDPTTVAIQPSRIAVPAAGAWTYHASGNRRIGAAGSSQPFSQDVATQVSRVGGDSQTPVLRLYTSSNSGSEDDQRRYGAAEVDWLSTRVSSAALSYGGTFSPPVPLIYWPAKVGASWTTSWTTGDTNGRTITTLTGTRQAIVEGRGYTCYLTKSDSNFTGSVRGTMQTTSCWVPQLGMSAEDHQIEQGTYDGVSFYADTDAVLQKTP